MSVLQVVETAVGMDKVRILAREIEQLKRRIDDAGKGLTLDEETELLQLSKLSAEYGVAAETLRANIRTALGFDAVFRLGMTWVIRKVRFLDYLKCLESDDAR